MQLKQSLALKPQSLAEFTNLHIREFPAELQGRAKAAAALKRMDLKDWVISAIERELSQQSTNRR